MIVVDRDALKANLSVLEGMCKATNEIVSVENVEDKDLINFSNQILSMAHWLMQISFINLPDPKPPEPMKELQEE